MASPSPQCILIIGAGELGVAMLEGLAGYNHNHHPSSSSSSPPPSLTVLLRPSTLTSPNPIKARANAYLLSLGASLIPGDIVQDTTASLAAIFRAYDVVVVCSGFGDAFPPGTQLKLANAAIMGKVKRFFPWQWGIDYDVVGEGSAQDLFDEQGAVRRVLREQGDGGVDWVVVSTGLFVSFIFVPSFGPVDLPNRTLRALGSWDTRLSVTTPRDIGRVAAALIFDPQSVHRQVVFAAGDTVSYGEIADLVERRFGGKWNRELWDMHTLRKRLDYSPDDGMVKYQNVFGEGRGVAWDMEDTVNWQRGMEMQTVEEYLREMEDLD
ncbi:NAD(P)-binding protein [Nemania sp. FL0916]|nr:NAD(P)-binding protein [Nemania sp. FL0916]